MVSLKNWCSLNNIPLCGKIGIFSLKCFFGGAIFLWWMRVCKFRRIYIHAHRQILFSFCLKSFSIWESWLGKMFSSTYSSIIIRISLSLKFMKSKILTSSFCRHAQQNPPKIMSLVCDVNKLRASCQNVVY